MRSRTAHFLLAILWFVWTGVIIPAHTRGVIPLGPAATKATPATSFLAGLTLPPCCCNRQTPDRGAPHDHSKPVPSSPGNCAICQMVAMLSHGTACAVFLPDLGLAERFVPLPPIPPMAAAPDHPRRSRGPPLLARV